MKELFFLNSLPREPDAKYVLTPDGFIEAGKFIIGNEEITTKGVGKVDYFMVGVGRVEAWKGDQSLFTSKTLVDSSITIGVTAEEIRAGEGAKLYAKYFHSSSFDMTFTDALFRMEYVAMNTGSVIQMGGDSITYEEVVLGAGGIGTVKGTPHIFGEYGTIGWIAKPGSSDWTKVSFIGNEFTVSDVEGTIYCVKYPEYDSGARSLQVSANIIPDTITIYLTANLFAGDASNPETGTKVGKITIKIPRFLLNGAQTISMSMTGVANSDLSGSALAVGGVGCEGEGYYAEITESIFNRNWYDSVIGLQISDANFDLSTGESKKLEIYAIYSNTAPKLINNSEFTFVSSSPSVATVSSIGVVSGVSNGNSTITARITDKPSITGVALVTVES